MFAIIVLPDSNHLKEKEKRVRGSDAKKKTCIPMTGQVSTGTKQRQKRAWNICNTSSSDWNRYKASGSFEV